MKKIILILTITILYSCEEKPRLPIKHKIIQGMGEVRDYYNVTSEIEYRNNGCVSFYGYKDFETYNRHYIVCGTFSQEF